MAKPRSAYYQQPFATPRDLDRSVALETFYRQRHQVWTPAQIIGEVVRRAVRNA